MILFNEIDPIACAVLRECYDGHVLERSIKDLQPGDLDGYERVHFFAGAGLWEVACELAGWVGPIWTGSCPCQPFSVAGKGAGTNDPRHLWPDMFRLIDDCRPRICVGEQVGGKAGYGWLDGVRADLESIDYACWAVDIPACAVDAPHKRNRIYWVASLGDADGSGRIGPRLHGGKRQGISLPAGPDGPEPHGADCQSGMADTNGGDAGAERQQLRGQQRQQQAAGSHSRPTRDGERPEDVLADADRRGRDGRAQDPLGRAGRRDVAERADVGDAYSTRANFDAEASRSRATTSESNGSFWSDAEWLRCADGKARRSKPGLRLLVDGLGGRADLWRLAGNSIVPQVAAEVLIALKETLDEMRPVRVNDLFG